ncbi:hypothetical protein GCM10011495_20880 [Hymenobacter frigidus]|uniref:SWIM-type domain-containing protein n=1 Tax=Hymenobacter frigidus TaxID=1524095 RepID=A0ABQ2A721_9BACT|nr:hypothetical protein [Hymenobacter frigidus]GGH85800.1 hypothetical protein GCM10011495_20880 [Hymenobacter frigidus]
MFTEADLEALVPRKIFERGSAYYYEDNAVGRIRRTGDTFKAKVEGTETYRVELTIRAGKPPKIYCDCPYDYGDVCKHGIALGLAVLEWFGSAESEQAPATPEVLTGKDRRAHLLTAAWARTSDRQRLDFLRQQLLQKPKQLHRFLEVFEFDEAALLAAGLREQPGSSKSVPARRSSPPLATRSLPLRRPLTFLEQAHRLIKDKKTQELLPLLLATDWLRESAGNNPQAWAAVLAASAQVQPDATFDAVMERFEEYLNNQSLRGSPLYYFMATCLRTLVVLPALGQQVQLFASELLQRYRRLTSLRQALTTAGFFPIENELATGLPPKKRGRPPGNPTR